MFKINSFIINQNGALMGKTYININKLLEKPYTSFVHEVVYTDPSMIFNVIFNRLVKF